MALASGIDLAGGRRFPVGPPRQAATGFAGPSLRCGPSGAARRLTRACRFAPAAHPPFRRRLRWFGSKGVEKPIDPQMVAALEAALLALPGRQRLIFLAVRRDESSYSAIADRLGITVADVEQGFAQTLLALVRAADG